MFSDNTVVDMFKDRPLRCCGECRRLLFWTSGGYCPATGKFIEPWNIYRKTYVHCDKYEKKEEPKPCPYCGKKATIRKVQITRMPWWDVFCEDCLTTASGDSKEEAVVRWNNFVDEARNRRGNNA